MRIIGIRKASAADGSSHNGAGFVSNRIAVTIRRGFALALAFALILALCASCAGGGVGGGGSGGSGVTGGGAGGGSGGEELVWQDKLARALSVEPLPYEAPRPQDRPDETGRTWYQVFVYSFCDSNGDGVGDLNGVTERLDYIALTGFDGVWLSPIHPSDTYHKYDVKDYYSIDPEYGTMEDFERFMDACRERGLKVLLDLVVNHTSIDHPWFEEHPEYYHIQDEPGHGQWKQLPDGKYYECQFWERMPDLNLEYPELRAELEAVIAFWLGKGVDGFRLDAVKEFETGNAEINIEILSWITHAAKAIKPDAYIVGEDWDTTDALYRYYQSGVDSLFSFPFAGADGPIGKTLIQNAPLADYLEKLVSSQDSIKENNPRGTAAPFFTNHDNARAAGFLRKNPDLIKTAWGMSLMQPGDAFVYYGEELGMSGSGKDENKRAPMFWTDEQGAEGMTSGPPGMDGVTHSFPPAAEQAGDENSIYSYLRKAVLLRAKYPEIGRGDIAIIDLGLGAEAAGRVGAVERTWEGGKIIIIYNVSPDEARIPMEGHSPADFLSASGAEPALQGGVLVLPGYTIAILI